MSAQEQRETIIHDNLPYLVTALTGFTTDDENFNLCLQYAESKIATHRNLSVNSHEVRRRIDGLAERFVASNYTSYANRLKELCNSFVADPLCNNHYETDVQWSVLHFLLEMSRNPVSALSENKSQIPLTDVEDDDEATRRNECEQFMSEMIDSLVLVNEPANNTKYEDSDLSEWSDDDDEDTEPPAEIKPVEVAPQPGPPARRPVVIVTELKPPQPIPNYIEYTGENAREWLKENVQHSWWFDPMYKEPIHSEFPSANFNQIYGKFLEKETSGAYRADDVSIISEWCLLREIIWMFNYSYNPGEIIDPDYGFKFFALNQATDEIVVKDRVSLASVSTQGTKAMLEKFTPHMTYLYRLRKFVLEIVQYNRIDGAVEPPQTVQCYAIGMQDFLREFLRVLCQKEAAIIERDPFEVHTVIRLFVEMQPHCRFLEQLYEIHQSCYLDYRLYPPHISSMYLISRLVFKIENAFMPTYLNKVGGLFFATIQYYFHVFRNLWSTARLDDWLHEFPIEKMDAVDMVELHTQNDYRARSYDLRVIISKLQDKNVKPSPSQILETIKRCKFLQLITEQCLDGAHVIDIVFNLNKFPSMLSMFYANNVERNPQVEFEEKCMREFEEWRASGHTSRKKESKDVVLAAQPVNVNNNGTSSSQGQNASLNPVEFLGDDNPLLFLVFEETFRRSGLLPVEQPDASQVDKKPLPKSSYEFYCAFDDITDFFLPIMNVVQKYTREVLETRINISNEYVLNMYLNEFDIMKHISNLRLIFLLGAGDAMQTFYANLFDRMNAGDNWSNPYLLTVQLDGILSLQFPEMASMFSIHLKSANWLTKKPLTAIKDIVLIYNVQESVRDVIQIGHLNKYNAVFQFLMQVKWAIRTLETHRFPILFKRRRPYSPMNMFDLIFKRLAMARNWIMYSVQSVHSHLMTNVIQSMGQQLPKKIGKAKSLRDIMEIHGFYIDTIYDYCFQSSKDKELRKGIEQMLSLVAVLHDEWHNLEALDDELMCAGEMAANGSSVSALEAFDLAAAAQQVDGIENAYISCHNAIADILSQEVFIRDREDLAALSAAFTCSCPC